MVFRMQGVRSDDIMARPKKKGLIYFPKDVDYYDDVKIMDLLCEYGPLGQTIYDIILTYVYKNGYYLNISPDKLASLIVRIVGNRWIAEKDLVLQVIDYCADIGLFDKELLSRNIITSVGIQRRYSEVTVRSKADTSEYWLLEKKSSGDDISEAETRISETKTAVSEANIPQSKVNKIKSNESKVVCASPTDAQTHGPHGLIKLTSEQYEQLIADYGRSVIDEYIEKIGAYLSAGNIKPFSNHYATILKWLQGDGIKKRSEFSNNIEKIIQQAMKSTPKLKKPDTSEFSKE